MIRIATCAALVVALGCSANEAVDDAPPMPVADSGGGAFDGSFADAGQAPDQDAAPTLGLDEDRLPATPTTEGLADAAFNEIGRSIAYDDCYDDDALVCDPDSCAGSRACCVGDGDCCSDEEGASLPETLPLGVCVGEELTACLAMAGVPVAESGNPGPSIIDGILYPGGTESHDGVLEVGTPVDLTTRRVSITATFVRAEACGIGCVESAAFGFTGPDTFDTTTSVRPIISLSYGAQRSEVTLRVGDTIVEQWSLEAASESWSLTVRPTGGATITRDGIALLESAAFIPTRNAQLVFFGRSRNMSPDDQRAGFSQIDIGTFLCDVPTSWEPRRAIALSDPGGAWNPPLLGRAVTAQAQDGSVMLALATEGGIWVAGNQDGSSDAFTFDDRDTPTIAADRPSRQRGARDPWLLRDEDNARWILLFTAVDDAGVSSIGRAERPDGGVWEVDPDSYIKPLDFGFTDLDMPTGLIHFTGEWVIVARAALSQDTKTLAILRSPDAGTDWRHQERGGLAGLTTRGNEIDVPGFDGDEIAAPSLVIHNGAWQLYYAGRRGARWQIGLLASDELLAWRQVEGGAVLSRSPSGFDRVGVRSPSVLIGAQRIDLFYVGLDGARGTLAAAGRPATALGQFL